MPRDHRKLTVFIQADQLALQAYRLTASFPASERYGLISQIRRAAVSGPCNIVEGAGRSSQPAFAHFLDIAAGSVAETRYLMQLARRLEFIACDTVARFDDDADHLLRSINLLRQTIVADSEKRKTHRE